MKQLLMKYRYEVIAALSGSVVMMLELVGARMMAPYFGTSTYVWTAMIGVILGALSLGYWYGGRLADKGANDHSLMIIIVVASLCVALTMWLQTLVLTLIAQLDIDVRIQALITGLLLFAPASALLGVVSPYVAKLKISSLQTAGASIGQLYAAGTLGSIIGTFLAGYWLIAWFGNFHLGVGLVVALVGLSFIAEYQTLRLARIAGVGIGVGLLLLTQTQNPNIVADIDSAYARYQVVETTQGENQKRYLMMDNLGVQSGISVRDSDALIFPYTQAFQSVMQSYGTPSNLLVIGGGAYTFPRWAAQQTMHPQVDVVEIDPALDAIASQYFAYSPRSNLRLTHEDGRLFLNRNTTQYDLVYIDAFASLTPPFQLATREATEHMRHALTDTGIMAVNVVASADNDDPYLGSTYQTYQSVFPRVKIYQMQQEALISQRQNLLFLMGNEETMARIEPQLQLPSVAMPISGHVLSDDYAPVEQLIQKSES